MAGSTGNQRKAKKDRADRRKRAKELGLVRPIIARHRKGTQPREKKKPKPIRVVYQLVLLYGPWNDYEVDGWVRNMEVYFGKTDVEALAIIERAKEYAAQEPGTESSPPVLASCRSESNAKVRRSSLESSIRDATGIIEQKVQRKTKQKGKRRKRKKAAQWS